MSGPDGKDNCNKFVDILGLRTIFPLFMKTPKKNRKRVLTTEEHEGIFKIIFDYSFSTFLFRMLIILTVCTQQSIFNTSDHIVL